jgi:hypothetical protein
MIGLAESLFADNAHDDFSLPTSVLGGMAFSVTGDFVDCIPTAARETGALENAIDLFGILGHIGIHLPKTRTTEIVGRSDAEAVAARGKIETDHLVGGKFRHRLAIKMKCQQPFAAHLLHNDDFNFVDCVTMQVSCIDDLRG